MLVFVQCPIIGESTVELSPPLGLLRLAAIGRPIMQIVDLNLLWQEEDEAWRLDWPQSAIEVILRDSPKVIAFTSMAVDAGVVFDLSRLLKEKDEELSIIVGGPYFGAIPEQILRIENAIDVVVTGEAENIIVDLYDSLCKRGDLSDIPGISFRQGEVIKVNPPGKAVDLEALGLVNFDLVDLERYWKINRTRFLNIEFSRGCKYRCSFCYISSHYTNEVQVVSPVFAADLLAQAENLGAKEVFVVGDNFVNDKQWALDTCEEIAARKLDIRWTCYATLPEVDETLARALAKAGCSDVYIGVDAVSAGQQRSFNKRFVPGWGAIRETLTVLKENGIRTTAAFILNGVGETRFDTESNLHAAIDLKVRQLGSPRLNALVEYPGTTIARGFDTDRHCPSPLKIDLLQDVPPPTAKAEDADRYPDIFPFHTVDRDPAQGEQLVLLVFDMSHYLRQCPFTLQVLVEVLRAEQDSETPLVDWWDAEILPYVPETKRWRERKAQLDTQMTRFIEESQWKRLKEVWGKEKPL
jgi:hypothetical protein